MGKWLKPLLTLLFGAAVWLFWRMLYPQALNYAEQNQLFLWTHSYFLERVSVAGGLADWISEFLVQFFRIKWLGALILALLAIAMQASVLAAAGKKESGYWFASFIPPVLWTVMCGDMEFLLSYPVALISALLLCRPFSAAGINKLWAAPLLWWLIGPVAFIPVLYSLAANRNRKELAAFLWTVAVSYLLYRLFLMQYPLGRVAFGLNYYRIGIHTPSTQIILPIVALACVLFIKWLKPRGIAPVLNPLLTVAVIITGWFGAKASYDKDGWEILAYTALERESAFQEIIKRAEKYQPKSAISAVYVNYALAMEGKLADRMWEFHQCGTSGLILPSIRDNMSNVASCDILWMIGMNNIALQYAFDTQEAIPNGRKSGRFTSRIAECHIVNGHYEIARRYLDKLTHSIFYRKWALERLAMIDAGDEGIDTDPVYRYLRRFGFQDDFLANYNRLDVMMAILYKENKSNIAAAIYYNAWQQLKKADTQRNEENTDISSHGS